MSSSEENLRKGPWSPEEDECLRASVALLGERRWDSIAKATGLTRSGKSCRLRWLNYLRPNLKQSPISVEEERIILRLHERWGNKWARIARRLPGRTDNEIKNYWRTYTRRKITQMDQTKDTSNERVAEFTHSSNSSSDNEIAEANDGTSREERSSSCSLDEDVNLNEGLSDALMHAKSPYEDHFSDWMSLLLNGESEFLGFGWNGSSDGLASCSGYPDWSYEEGDSRAWDCSDTLWAWACSEFS